MGGTYSNTRWGDEIRFILSVFTSITLSLIHTLFIILKVKTTEKSNMTRAHGDSPEYLHRISPPVLLLLPSDSEMLVLEKLK
jgi:hypothetical protein